MPYNAVQATKSIVVQAISVSLSISPSQPWTAGQTLTFKVKVYSNSTLLTNRSIRILIGFQSVGYAEILTGSTGSTGEYTGTWTVPWRITLTTPTGPAEITVPCRVWWFQAYDTASSVASSIITGNIAYPTRISISAPDTAVPAQSITVSGKLEYQDTSTTWSPLTNRKVSLYINGTKIADVTTDSSGNYSYTFAIQVGPGTYTLKASYAGEGFTSLAITAVQITSLTPAVQITALTLAPLLTGIVLIATTKVV